MSVTPAFSTTTVSLVPGLPSKSFVHILSLSHTHAAIYLFPPPHTPYSIRSNTYTLMCMQIPLVVVNMATAPCFNGEKLTRKDVCDTSIILVGTYVCL